MAAVAVPHELPTRPDMETAREVSAKMTKARAKAMVRELLSGYAAKSFQAKLTEILEKEATTEGGVVADESPARWAWAENVHNDILAQYGFATGHGMESLTLPLELILKSCPDCLGNVKKIGEYLKLKTWPISDTDSIPKAKKDWPISDQSPSVSTLGRTPSLSKPRALALQTELLAIFSTPCFQKKLAEMSRKLPHDSALPEYNRATGLQKSVACCLHVDLNNSVNVIWNVWVIMYMHMPHTHIYIHIHVYIYISFVLLPSRLADHTFTGSKDALCKLFDDAQMETIARPGHRCNDTPMYDRFCICLIGHWNTQPSAGMVLRRQKRVWRTRDVCMCLYCGTFR